MVSNQSQNKKPQAAGDRGAWEADDVTQRQERPYRSPQSKSTLKIVAGGSGVKPKRLRAGGLEPSESMVPGQYVAACEGATITTKGKTTIAVLEFRIIDEPYSGTALRQWVAIPDVDGVVPIGSRYGRQCKLALGREIEPGDDLDPGSIFRGRFFLIDVGFRMTVKSGGTATHENALRRKDQKDFLRVHKLVELRELP
jgi:hypothetical protein